MQTSTNVAPWPLGRRFAVAAGRRHHFAIPMGTTCEEEVAACPVDNRQKSRDWESNRLATCKVLSSRD